MEKSPNREIVPEPAEILVVNDHEWSARSIETVLQAAGHRVTRALTVTQALSAIAIRSPDAIILDTQLPDGNGPDLCVQLHNDGLIDAGTPVVITTAAPTGRIDRLKAMQSGAWDFVPLPIDGELFILKLGNLLAIRQAVREAIFVDPATGFCTETGLYVRGSQLASAADSQGLQMSCVLVRIKPDDWNANRRLREAGRRSDVYAMVGNDELAVLALVATDAGAQALAERLSASLRGAGRGGGQNIAIGYATTKSPAAGAVRSLLHWAERAATQALSQNADRPLGHHELALSPAT